MNLLHPTLLTALLATASAGAQTPQAETPASAAGMSTPYSDSYVSRCGCLLYTSPSPRDATLSRMPSSA